MSDFTFHPKALADLSEIGEYLAGRSADAAGDLIDEFFRAFEHLSRFPAAGFRRANLSRFPLRFWVVREYLVAYAPDRRPVSIIAIVHGRRSPRVFSSILRSRL